MGLREYAAPYTRKNMPFGLMTRRTLSITVIVTVILTIFLLTARHSDYYGRSLGSVPAPSHEQQDWTPGHAGGKQQKSHSDEDVFHRFGDFSESDRPIMATDPLCVNFPDISNIAVVMKTGASESYARIPTQLVTSMRCVPDLVIFSDMEETIAGVHVRDCLDNMLEEAVKNNKEFDLYRDQKACVVDQNHCTQNRNKADDGWKLDKYKNIHMAEKIWKLRPGKDWYIFIDADTYLIWNSVVQWLKKLDPSKPVYMGSVALINDFPFGHGGSGYIVSRAAMSNLIDKNPGVANSWDMDLHNHCCGDYMFARAMKENASVEVSQMWPTINGEKFWTIPYGPTHWCHPLTTMHHLNAEEISRFWEWEIRRYGTSAERSSPSPVRIKELFHAFMEPHMIEMRRDWDNFSDDRYYLNRTLKEYESWQLDKTKPDKSLSSSEKEAWRSPTHCRIACEKLDECYQWKWEDNICGISWAFKMGAPIKTKDRGNKGRLTSGWDTVKIRDWISQQDCGKNVKWPMPK